MVQATSVLRSLSTGTQAVLDEGLLAEVKLPASVPRHEGSSRAPTVNGPGNPSGRTQSGTAGRSFAVATLFRPISDIRHLHSSLQRAMRSRAARRVPVTMTSLLRRLDVPTLV
jgi:hypothetical protein